MVGRKKKPPSKSFPCGPGAAAHDHPLFAPDVHVADHLAHRPVVDQRAQVGVVLEPVPEPQLLGARLQPVDEVARDVPVEQETAGRGAALSGGPERAPQHALERELEVGVGHHDLRVLPTHLEREPLVQPSAHLADPGARRRGAGERDHGHVRVLDDGRPRLLPGAVHQVHDLGGAARLEQDLDEERAGVRHVLGGLEDDAVPARERGKDLPRRNRHREVERRDHAAHADRAPEAHRPLLAQLGGTVAPYGRRHSPAA